MARDVVHMLEDEDGDFTGERFDAFATGRFSGHLDRGGNRPSAEFEGLPLPQAVAWGRERAARVIVNLDGTLHTAGSEPVDGLPPLPDPIPELARRRVTFEAWKDRTPDDPPAEWDAAIGLSPPDATDLRRRRAWEKVVAEVAETIGGRWDAESIENYFADVRRAGRNARRRGEEEYGWTTYWSPSYHVHVRVSAPTEKQAVRAAMQRVPPLPEGWHAYAHVTFAG